MKIIAGKSSPWQIMLYRAAFCYGDEVSSTFPCRRTPAKTEKAPPWACTQQPKLSHSLFQSMSFWGKKLDDSIYTHVRRHSSKGVNSISASGKRDGRSSGNKVLLRQKPVSSAFWYFHNKNYNKKGAVTEPQEGAIPHGKLLKALEPKCQPFLITPLQEAVVLSVLRRHQSSPPGPHSQFSTSGISVGCNGREWGFWKER